MNAKEFVKKWHRQDYQSPPDKDQMEAELTELLGQAVQLGFTSYYPDSQEEIDNHVVDALKTLRGEK